MPETVLFGLGQARAAHIAVSPQHEDDKICVILQLNYAAHANFSMLWGKRPIRPHARTATTRTFQHHHSRAAGRSPGRLE